MTDEGESEGEGESERAVRSGELNGIQCNSIQENGNEARSKRMGRSKRLISSTGNCITRTVLPLEQENLIKRKCRPSQFVPRERLCTCVKYARRGAARFGSVRCC